MGQELKTANFTAADFEEFAKRLQQETALLKQLFDNRLFEQTGHCCGFEVEGWILDKDQLPSPQSDKLLASLGNSQIVPELSLFNFEYNSNPLLISEQLLGSIHDELRQILAVIRKKAQALNCDITTIGTLPTLTQAMLSKENIYPNKRFEALDKELKKLRQNRSIPLDVQGQEHLSVSHDNILLETISTSLQIHLQLQASKSVRYYNAGYIIAAPLVAIAGNSPFLFGKKLWEESRIPVFEQVVDTPGLNQQNSTALSRVSFGNGYAQNSILELFYENLKYPILLPELMNKKPECLSHLSFHNGTIWRWNRPLIGINAEGVPHIRLEQRVSAAGPSAIDMIANIGFFLGLMRYYAYTQIPPEKILSFKQTKHNFYSAARYGLNANVDWINKTHVPLKELILKVLLPQAKQGLKKLSIADSSINYYLDNVIKPRVTSGQTGSIWQQQFIKKHGLDFQEMLFQYNEWQKKDLPVHEWGL